MTKFDLISIGDNATDAFIKLAEAELNCEIDRPECKICLKFASKIPYDSVTEIPAGGNSSNIAIGATKLGLNTSYFSVIGDDNNGEKTLVKLKQTGINTDLISIQKNTATNYNYVLWYQDDRTILVKHENYKFNWPTNLETPSWIYLSSVSDEDFSLHIKLNLWLEEHPETKLAFSPGTWQIKMGREKLENLYAKTEIFFSNKQEAEKILKTPNSTPKILAEEIKKLGPNIVVITDGENGAYCLDQNNIFWQIPVFNKLSPAIERTGAGDAFSTAFLSAIFYQKNIDQALIWGAINAASVVTKVGPHEGLLTQEEIEKISADSPDFTAKQI